MEFLVVTKQMEKADNEVQKAQQAIKDKPLSVARCCELLGQAYKSVLRGEQKAKVWTEQAARWYAVARNADPRNHDVIRQYIDFLLRSGDLETAKARLDAIRSNATPADAEERAWATRTLALTLASSKDEQQRARSVELLQASDRPEDLRAFATVCEAQHKPEYDQKARAALEALDREEQAQPEDRFRLAGLYSKDGNWVKAHEQYQKLLAQSENTTDPGVFRRRPEYLARYFDELLKNSQGSRSKELLAEAQALVDQLKLFSPNALSTVIREAQLLKAQDQPDQVVDLLLAKARLPNELEPLWSSGQHELAALADKLGLARQVEAAMREAVKTSNSSRDRFVLANFLAVHGRLREALDVCEPLWSGTGQPELLVKNTLELLPDTLSESDQEPLERVAGWLQNALEKAPKSGDLMVGLAGLRERQKRFSEAENLYLECVQQGNQNPLVLNNLAWLRALRDAELPGALELIGRAIKNPGQTSVPELLDTRAVIRLKRGETQQAIDDLNQAISMKPTPSKYFHLAQAYLRAGRKADAIEMLAKARPKGMTPEKLHDLEIPAYRKLLADLGVP